MGLKILRKGEKGKDYNGPKWERIQFDSNTRPGDPNGWGYASVRGVGAWNRPPDPNDPNDWEVSWDDSDDPNKGGWKSSRGMNRAAAISFAQAKVKELCNRPARLDYGKPSGKQAGF